MPTRTACKHTSLDNFNISFSFFPQDFDLTFSIFRIQFVFITDKVVLEKLMANDWEDMVPCDCDYAVCSSTFSKFASPFSDLPRIIGLFLAVYYDRDVDEGKGSLGLSRMLILFLRLLRACTDFLNFIERSP